MKAYIIILLLGISLSYNPKAAIEYANKYCSNYNKIFYNYNSENDGRDSANFVSQCLHEGGQSFEGCNGVDLKGMIPRVSDLKACLLSKGWKSSLGVKPVNFKAGYPIFIKNYHRAMLATDVKGDTINYSGHSPDRCNAKFRANVIEFYYL